MKVTTYEAIVENGQIKFSETVRLPEHAKNYVVVTGIEEVPRYHMGGPRLARPENAADFVKEVIEESQDAGLR